MVDLKAKPFYLNDEQIKWVEDTIASMTLDEKIGQLFVLMQAGPAATEEQIAGKLSAFHQGGLRWQGGNKDSTYFQNTTYQKHSKIPLLIAANCDDGGNGVCPEGTFVSTAVEAGAGDVDETAYHMGLVAGREATALGVNWMFNPVADVYMNWRNTIVNTRSFGTDIDRVIRGVRGYIRGIKDANPNMAACCKHFPGDGVEELDQHLALGVNNLSVEEWNATFRKVYETAIDEGLETIMVGHIALPQMSKHLRPGMTDAEVMPATLAPELITDLLRGEMGFNGLVITDASHMIGMSAMSRRCDAVPGAFIAGCDMFLFSDQPEEDYGYVKAALEDGRLTEERLSDALHHILGLKAKLHLYEESVRIPDPALKDKWIGCEEHKEYTRAAAEKSVTLVKDTIHMIPVNPAEKKRVFLVYVQSTPTSKGYKGDPVKQVVVEELERAGFEVHLCPNFHDLEVERGVSPMNMALMMSHGTRAQFAAENDLALIVINVKGYAQENHVRLRWSCNHSCELPWYNLEIPTAAISLNYTNHMIDVPNVHTFINAYAPDRACIRAAIEKLTGKSEFEGVAEDTVFCGRWDTRL